MTGTPQSDEPSSGRVTRPPADPRKWPAWARSFPGGHLLVLRAFLGVTFCFAGLQKLANRGFFEASNPGSLQAQLRASALTTPVGRLMEPAVHVAVLLGLVIAFGEIAVGVGTLLGLYARVAATGGMLLALSFFLTVSYNTSPYYYGPDIVFTFAWTVLALNGAGALSLDAYFLRRAEERAAAPATVPEHPRLDRRAALTKLAAVSFVGSAVVFLGGVTAAAGRLLAPKTTAGSEEFPVAGGSDSGPTSSTTAGSGSTPTTSAAPTTSSTTAGSGSTPTTSAGAPTTTTGAKPQGKLITATSAVPVGGAAGFTDPFQGIPAYLVQPRADAFLAFSAVCTHAGCTVAFVQSAEQFQCPCHGSIFSASTGEVIQGPATQPLPSITIDVTGGDVYVTD